MCIYLIIYVEINKNKTTPPPSYDEDLLLKVMDNPGGLMEEAHLRKAIKGHGIGTVATRKDFIETLMRENILQGLTISSMPHHLESI